MRSIGKAISILIASWLIYVYIYEQFRELFDRTWIDGVVIVLIAVAAAAVFFNDGVPD